MLLKRKTLHGIRDGSISLVFRRWLRPTVKSGGTLLTAIGQLSIDAVDEVSLTSITATDAAAAGYDDAVTLKAELRRREGSVYRVRVSLLGDDPRVALRSAVPQGAELESLVERLARLDSRSTDGPWTRDLLTMIAKRPAVRAGDLADDFDMVKADFKTRVRKLKGLGLTESLKIGYRLSPRGTAVLRRLRRE